MFQELAFEVFLAPSLNKNQQFFLFFDAQKARELESFEEIFIVCDIYC
jgi:hypothetical protein